MENRRIGIALGSGGAKGISHIGVLEVLEKNNIKINEISGCSIGAIVGGIYAAGVSIEKMKEIAFSIDIKKMWKLFDFTKPTSGGVVKGNLVEQFLDEILPVKKFEDLKIPFRCVATDIKEGKEVIFEKGDLIPAIRASISIPGLFVPYEYQGRLLVDGGVVNPVPVSLLKETNYNIAVVVEEFKIIKKLSIKKAAISDKIKKIKNEKFQSIIKYLPTKTKNVNEKKRYGIIKILSSTLNTLQEELLEVNSNRYKVDAILRPDVGDIATLGFYDGYKSYRKGVEAAEKFLSERSDLI